MSNDKVRAELEEWAVRNRFITAKIDGRYVYEQTNYAWLGWCGSRAALVVELPKEPEDPWGAMPYDRGQVDAMRVMLEDCKSALDAAGVAYK